MEEILGSCDCCHRPGVRGTCPACQAWKKDWAKRGEHSGPAKFRFFEGIRFVGEREFEIAPVEWGDGYRSAYHPSTAYVCPECGELWGRAVMCPSTSYKPICRGNWVVETRACPKHGDGYFLVGLSSPQLASCSLELLKREALLLCIHHKE